jgi:hypothetical protein
MISYQIVFFLKKKKKTLNYYLLMEKIKEKIAVLVISLNNKLLTVISK